MPPLWRAARSNWPAPLTAWRCSAPAPIDSDSLMVMEAEGFNPVNRARPAAPLPPWARPKAWKASAWFRPLATPKISAKSLRALRLRRVIVTGLDRTRRLGATVAAVTGGAGLAHVTLGRAPTIRWKR